MTKVSREKFSSDFKARVAIEALKEQKTVPELAPEFQQSQIQKKHFLEVRHAIDCVTKLLWHAG